GRTPAGTGQDTRSRGGLEPDPPSMGCGCRLRKRGGRRHNDRCNSAERDKTGRGATATLVPAFRRVVRRLHRRGGAGEALVSHQRADVRVGDRGSAPRDGQRRQRGRGLLRVLGLV
ncbi:unnamed protein product, partial [Ectocarpus fasciculatus]